MENERNENGRTVFYALFVATAAIVFGMGALFAIGQIGLPNAKNTIVVAPTEQKDANACGTDSCKCRCNEDKGYSSDKEAGDLAGTSCSSECDNCGMKDCACDCANGKDCACNSEGNSCECGDKFSERSIGKECTCGCSNGKECACGGESVSKGCGLQNEVNCPAYSSEGLSTGEAPAAKTCGCGT